MTARPGSVGATRECPHCRETILASAAVCPACRHHVRFDEAANTALAPESVSALRVDGSIRHPEASEASEYTVVLTIQDERGEELVRKLIGVGALMSGEQRSFTLSVEVTAATHAGLAQRRRLVRH